ncbi:hypothetical protein QN277_014045 [Acacia crassicarpa]|uniref:glucan endo-1,3-beta-D-glucosidase n=1 Tax=Acacia crassicarpa TaxID=499986 RepID=A0AAE1N4Z5_9FABA|nr:hypothetical protein QN277_014045 [Acacia crassicarpa]
MKLKRWLACILCFTVTILSCTSSAFVGVNIGTDVSNLPSAVDVVAFLKAHQITHVCLYDANTRMLQALANSGIQVIVGATNEELLRVGEPPSIAACHARKGTLDNSRARALRIGLGG